MAQSLFKAAAAYLGWLIALLAIVKFPSIFYEPSMYSQANPMVFAFTEFLSGLAFIPLILLLAAGAGHDSAIFRRRRNIASLTFIICFSVLMSISSFLGIIFSKYIPGVWFLIFILSFLFCAIIANLLVKGETNPNKISGKRLSGVCVLTIILFGIWFLFSIITIKCVHRMSVEIDIFASVILVLTLFLAKLFREIILSWLHANEANDKRSCELKAVASENS